MEKATLGFHIYKMWQILKCFAGTFHRAQTLKLGGVYLQNRVRGTFWNFLKKWGNEWNFHKLHSFPRNLEHCVLMCAPTYFKKLQVCVLGKHKSLVNFWTSSCKPKPSKNEVLLPQNEGGGVIHDHFQSQTFVLQKICVQFRFKKVNFRSARSPSISVDAGRSSYKITSS